MDGDRLRLPAEFRCVLRCAVDSSSVCEVMYESSNVCVRLGGDRVRERFVDIVETEDIESMDLERARLVALLPASISGLGLLFFLCSASSLAIVSFATPFLLSIDVRARVTVFCSHTGSD